MRVALITAAAAIAVVACVDFGLDDRRYRCDEDPDICGDGWSCTGGFCEPDGADASVEEPEPAVCEEENAGNVCDDDNPCTDNECNEDGDCVHTPRPDRTPCGEGCLCEDGEPTDVRECPDQCPTDQQCCDGVCRRVC